MMFQTALLLSPSAGLEAHPGTKWPGRETDQTPQYAGVKSDCSCTSTSPYVFMACKGTSSPLQAVRPIAIRVPFVDIRTSPV
jgi:hypothetical protein